MAAKTAKELNDLSNRIIGIAIDIHKKLGPGFQEKIYEGALFREFKKSGIGYEKQKVIRVDYDGQSLGNQRIDLPVVLHKNITIFHKIFRRFYTESHIPNITLNMCYTTSG